MSCNEGTERTNLPGSKNEGTEKSILNSDNDSENARNEKSIEEVKEQSNTSNAESAELKQQLADTEISAAPYTFAVHIKTVDFHYHLYGYFKCPFQKIRNQLRLPADLQENTHGSQMINLLLI